VPGGSRHKYRFHGPCRLVLVKHTTDKVAGAAVGNDRSSSIVGTAWARLEAVWDRETGSFSEQMSLEGDHPGRVSMQLKCAQDPVITGVLCHQVAYENATGWQGYDGAWLRSSPISRGRTTAAAAAEKSAQAASAPPVPPPPPPPPAAPEGRSPVRAARPSPGDPGTERGLNPQPEPPSRRIAPAEGVRIPLENGRTVAALDVDGTLRWAILGPAEEVLRVFPAGAAVLRDGVGQVAVDWGRGVYRAGRAKPARLRSRP
jgi:hypothetical protein